MFLTYLILRKLSHSGFIMKYIKNCLGAQFGPEMHKVLQDGVSEVDFINTSLKQNLVCNEMGNDHENLYTLQLGGYLMAKWLKQLSN